MSEEEKPADWRAIDGARIQVEGLLRTSGVILEADIAAKCQRFASIYSEDDLHISSERLIYGGSPDQAPREIDQVVTLYQEFPVGHGIGIQLVSHVLVEAKAQRGLQFFGVATGKDAWDPAPLPTVGTVQYSELISEAFAATSPPFLVGRKPLQVAGLLFKEDAQTPSKVNEEDLIYKAASSLYNFIHESAAAANVYEPDDEADRHATRYRDEGNVGASRVGLVDWLRNSVSTPPVKDQIVYHSVEIFCPVVCLDSPMFEVDIDPLGNISDFTSAEVLPTALRVTGWPHSMAATGAANTLGAITLVATVRGLQQILDNMARWATDRRAAIQRAPEDTIRWAVAEHQFIDAVIHDGRSPFTNRYRSDFGGLF